MDSGVYAAVNGARRTELRLSTLANNLANVNTTGYKEDRLTFESFMTSPGPELHPLPTDDFMGMRGPGDIPFPFSNPSSNAYRMTYPVAFETEVDVQQGALHGTNNPLHVAIEGEGFFVLNGPDGRRYTRDGSFEVNNVGELVSKDGYQVLGPGGEPIVVGDGPVNIAPDGFVTSNGEEVGTIARVKLPSEQLDKVGQNQYKAPQDLEVPVDAAQAQVHQGFLEGSNSNPIRAMTQMIEAQRAYEMHIKMIQNLDNLDDQAVNRIGRLQG
ncbi:flagellar basal body rod protein [Magnetococcus marinus MC-1]|uniref:Flagellar basal-body rod protein FlgF n=1 Tax=Magnetococcus marinus (strain ATCC BAA-1437 / JCM 17883 / MC-1) TaxID=156889 RepID=A0LC98_MAGMM|nr:flagellar basal-body rod protein FlgF [Magnetococcus marinus]ABK45591.1 flagellar basal body rod protein [Magnetococcus marinus MC-1]